ncbi:MAG: cytochrome c biogenesis protein CcsA [Gammaproteobacteria bacterium]|nr:cytochrome c biogenesis protein CcsA [Gammaproteobacteria bacterium]MCP4090468.1 cytochrome c biogenesis protein CcsA [Gammaproteobacteria bacterium]MCP4276667.1 cytochrome c biogenesis protein CcsA [Gammaproteobacteria bacterium]MCP4831417.1 cytochrome c biogenesis protein CcsA [Gammaproteobacteria bacterium]MCP4927961.1 cytochrome c biogenesis protein CcsA [Gammaproteobacteria bacterium]
MWNWFHKLASPPHFYRIASAFEPWLLWLAIACMLTGAYGGLVLAPADHVQGDGFRIIYVHVPAAFLSMFSYALMAVASGIGLIWRMKLAFSVAAATAPVGAAFTFLALVTGAIWGQPMWGSYWEWDPRLTSELILLFLFLGYIFLRQALAETRQADRASGILALVGVVNLPIIHYSVEWWNSIHQGPSLIKLEAPSITTDMLWPLLAMIIGYQLLFLAILMTSVRTQVLQREQNARWITEQLGTENIHG